MVESDIKLTVSVNINASKRDTWQIISKPGNLEYCHPFCEKNSVIRWGDANSKDTIKYYNGILYTRLFVNWYENDGYNLLIKNVDDTYAKVSWSVKSLSELTSELTICVSLFTNIILDRYPHFIRKTICRVFLLPGLNNYLKSVTKGFKYYLETGEKVKKNQFGNNIIFSKK